MSPSTSATALAGCPFLEDGGVSAAAVERSIARDATRSNLPSKFARDEVAALEASCDPLPATRRFLAPPPGDLARGSPLDSMDGKVFDASPSAPLFEAVGAATLLEGATSAWLESLASLSLSSSAAASGTSESCDRGVCAPSLAASEDSSPSLSSTPPLALRIASTFFSSSGNVCTFVFPRSGTGSVCAKFFFTSSRTS